MSEKENDKIIDNIIDNEMDMEDIYNFVDKEYHGNECPDCRKIFSSDDAFLAHVCKEKVYD